ncbi:hypothetical protein J3R83DRAFT_1644 [Lanmaoa asiatica]|nr:hypothetical protein J3R83DRAFT_1644 [Lanmaoa asiatica]
MIAWGFSRASISEYKRSLPPPKRGSLFQHNGSATAALNDQYGTLTVSSPCTDGNIACINGQFATPVLRWTSAGIPNEWSANTTTCDTNEDIAWIFSQDSISEF